MSLAVKHVRWQPCWRIIPGKFAEKRILRKLAADDDFETVAELEAMTNERLRQERGEAALVAPNDVVTGPGAKFIMAAFTDRNPEGSRFSDGSYGVYYAAHRKETAIAEVRHHREVFMRRTKEPPMRLEMRAIRAALAGRLHDIRGMQRRLPGAYSPTSYRESQALARELVTQGSFGVVYDSVRDKGGQCAAVFRPPVLSDARLAEQLIFEWDGKAIAKVYELKES